MEGTKISEKTHNSPDIADWLTLLRADGVGPKTFARLLKQFDTVPNVLEASVNQLTKVEGIGQKTAENIRRTIGKFNVDKELEIAENQGIQIINITDNRYPPPLKAIYDPPPILYIKGEIQRSDSLAVAIVGSRRCSTYGQEQASRFAHMLASAGLTIISGMARGIDTASHRGALSAKGRTIAVQGCGLTNIFPPENDKLFVSICEQGACISELPLQFEPLSQNFPARNRIIAGLSLATIVIEATSRSGALITAKAALENNREVMAVPGKIDSPLNVGSHRLIKDGARLIDSVDEIMEALGHIGEGLKPHVSACATRAKEEVEMPLFEVSRLNLTDPERAIHNCLDGDPKHIEEIIELTNLPAGAVNSGLISLRLKGLIKQLPGNLFLKK